MTRTPSPKREPTPTPVASDYVDFGVDDEAEAPPLFIPGELRV